MQSKPRIEVLPQNCRGCRRCEVACSWTGYGQRKKNSGSWDLLYPGNSCDPYYC